MRKQLVNALFLIGSLALVACGDNRPVEEVVAERAKKRWNDLIKQEYEKAYDYLSPAKKQITDRKKFENRLYNSILSYESADIKSVACNKNNKEIIDNCMVKVYIQAKVSNSTTHATLITETWILQDKKWWLAPK